MESYLISFLESYVPIVSKSKFICVSKITVCVCVCVTDIFVVPFHNPVGIPEIFNLLFLCTRNSCIPVSLLFLSVFI